MPLRAFLASALAACLILPSSSSSSSCCCWPPPRLALLLPSARRLPALPARLPASSEEESHADSPPLPLLSLLGADPAQWLSRTEERYEDSRSASAGSCSGVGAVGRLMILPALLALFSIMFRK